MNTSVDVTILPEVRQDIWNYCDKPSLKVLSVCCKRFYAEVKPFVWKRVELSWQFLEVITKELMKKPHPNIQLISCLVLGAPSLSASSLRNPSWGYFSFGFVRLLDRCERLKSLTMCNFLPVDGLRLVSENLPQLENLELRGITLRADDLKPLHGLLQLKSLTLRQCSTKNKHWNLIWQLESLENLTVTHCSTPAFLAFFRGGCSWKNLRSLDFFHIVECPGLYSCIAKRSVKLESLKLTGSSIQDSDILNVSHLPRLKFIHLFGADQITDLGISYLTHLPCLERLKISACHNLSPHCLEDIAKIQTLRSLDLDQFSEDANDISCLANLVNLHTLVISRIDLGLTDDALRVVAQLKSLRKLDIRDNNFTEEGIGHLAQLPHLRTLELNTSNINIERLEKYGLLGKVRIS